MWKLRVLASCLQMGMCAKDSPLRGRKLTLTFRLTWSRFSRHQVQLAMGGLTAAYE